MSLDHVKEQIERFLTRDGAEVISITGRWGVGKTYVWKDMIAKLKDKPKLRKYAYVSVFGVGSLNELKTRIVQETVNLDSTTLEPSLKSYIENLNKEDGIKNAMDGAWRKGFSRFRTVAEKIPVINLIADLAQSPPMFLFQKQIICIDDLERAGEGLKITDILGLVSLLCEEKGCKVVLLLNEDRLGDQQDDFRRYLEKAVNQAITLEPTPEEASKIASAVKDGLGEALGTMLAKRTIALGITNIRVIRRIRRFLSDIEPLLQDARDGVAERVIASVALFGWCVWEPDLTPIPDEIFYAIKNRYVWSLSEDEKPEKDEKQAARNRLASDIAEQSGIIEIKAIDRLILTGVQKGTFD